MNVLVDTGVWYAFCDARERPDDREHVESLDSLERTTVLAPWPVVYETIRTKFAKNKEALQKLDRSFRQLRVNLIDDSPYREEAFELAFDSSVWKVPPRPLSMVDCVLRLMLDDVDMKIDRFVTFNARDFSDICAKRSIELIQ